MPALSFQEMWIDKLLVGTKQQTTRKQTDRIKVGDVCHVYNQQRRRIADKPLRQLTSAGIAKMKAAYPFVKNTLCEHHAHFLGKVEIVEVYDIHPRGDNSARSAWAKADGFINFGEADKWFASRYGNDWYSQTWTVIRWDGWQERYFEPEAIR